MEHTIQPPWHQRQIAGVRLVHLLLVVSAYFFMGLAYAVTLGISSCSGKPSVWACIAEYVDQVAINYSVKLLLTALVWWLVFRVLKHWPLQRRILLHLPLSLLFIGTWFWLFRYICDRFDVGYLYGVGAAWDLYIPFLIYVLEFGIFHFYEYVQKARREAALAAEQKQLALTAEISALKAQIQPHFLFNTLNSISASVPPEQERTRELIALLADTFRFGLRASQSDTVPLGDELGFLRSYLDLEQQRFGARLQVHWAVEPAVLRWPVPPLLLQPLIENAIQHAVSPSVEPVTVGIRIWAADNGELCMEVSDTGPTPPQPEPPVLAANGLGLRNTRLRLEKEFGRSLHIRYNQPQGLVFTFQLPVP